MPNAALSTLLVTPPVVSMKLVTSITGVKVQTLAEQLPSTGSVSKLPHRPSSMCIFAMSELVEVPYTVAIELIEDLLKQRSPVVQSMLVYSLTGTLLTTWQIENPPLRTNLSMSPVAFCLVVGLQRYILMKEFVLSKTPMPLPPSLMMLQQVMGELTTNPSGNCMTMVRTMQQMPTKRQIKPPNSVLQVSSPLKFSFRGMLKRSNSEIHQF